jgi:hypothetical protein
MVVRAAKQRLDIRQFAIDYHPRGGDSKLSTWRDGWRHLRFLLVHSPTYLFILPALLMLALGSAIMLTVVAHVEILGREWDVHTMIAGSLLAIVGTQTVGLGVCAQAYGCYYLGERGSWFARLRPRLRLEHGLLLGGAVALAGGLVAATVVGIWIQRGFGALSEVRLAVLAATLIVIGIQVFFSSFLISIIGLRRGSARQ